MFQPCILTMPTSQCIRNCAIGSPMCFLLPPHGSASEAEPASLWVGLRGKLLWEGTQPHQCYMQTVLLCTSAGPRSFHLQTRSSLQCSPTCSPLNIPSENGPDACPGVRVKARGPFWTFLWPIHWVSGQAVSITRQHSNSDVLLTCQVSLGMSTHIPGFCASWLHLHGLPYTAATVSIRFQWPHCLSMAPRLEIL